MALAATGLRPGRAVQPADHHAHHVLGPDQPELSGVGALRRIVAEQQQVTGRNHVDPTQPGFRPHRAVRYRISAGRGDPLDHEPAIQPPPARGRPRPGAVRPFRAERQHNLVRADAGAAPAHQDPFAVAQAGPHASTLDSGDEPGRQAEPCQYRRGGEQQKAAGNDQDRRHPALLSDTRRPAGSASAAGTW